MIRSMTGFGRYSVTHEMCDVFIEMKTVNSKYLDIHLRMPKMLNYLDLEIKDIVKSKILRGKVDVFVDVKIKKAINIPHVNEDVLDHYVDAFRSICKRAGIEDSFTLSDFIGFDDVLSCDRIDVDEEVLRENIKDCLISCLLRVEQVRAFEGEKLYIDMLERISSLEKISEDVKKNQISIYDYWMNRFELRLCEIKELDDYKDRIMLEAATLAEKGDISEELTRIDSHLSQFRQVMDTDDYCGKKLDFICQEFFREFNTLVSKSHVLEIKRSVLEAKLEIDRIREQVQNVL